MRGMHHRFCGDRAGMNRPDQPARTDDRDEFDTAQSILSTSSAGEEVTAELPMLALILTLKFRPMIIGSSSGWFTFAGIIARPAATSARTNSGVTCSGSRAPKGCPWLTAASRLRSQSVVPAASTHAER